MDERAMTCPGRNWLILFLKLLFYHENDIKGSLLIQEEYENHSKYPCFRPQDP